MLAIVTDALYVSALNAVVIHTSTVLNLTGEHNGHLGQNTAIKVQVL